MQECLLGGDNGEVIEASRGDTMLSPTFASRTRVSPLFYSTVIILCVLSRGLTLAASTHSGSLSVSEQCLKSGKEAWTGG